MTDRIGHQHLLQATRGSGAASQRALKATDPWGHAPKMDARILSAAAAQLEARGKHPFFRHVVDEYLTQLGLSGFEAVLDLGCGTGIAARSVARRFPSGAPIAAVDVSKHLVALGRRIAGEEGCAHRIAFQVGDAHQLGFADGIFDVVIMHTLLSHVASPAVVLAEARRLLRPGSGRLVVFEGDQASLTFATDAPDGGDATDRALQGSGVAHPRVMRSMPRLLAEAGYALLGGRSHAVADMGKASFFASALGPMRTLIPMSGAMSNSEANAFVASLERAIERDSFFAAMAFYTYFAQRHG